MKGAVWTEYQPPDESVLVNTNLSDHQLRAALRFLCAASKRASRIEMDNSFEMLFVADEIIGLPEFHQNKHVGRVLHIRNFIIQKLWDKRGCVKMVRRWDRRMMGVLPDAE